MATQVHTADYSQPLRGRNGLGRKPVETERQSLNRKARHTVPSTLQAYELGEIVAAMRAGRNVAQTAKEYDASAFVPVELWMRDLERRVVAMERRLAAMARPLAATACLLMGVAMADVWASATGAAVTVERGFRRGGRARKRGLEDGLMLIELRQAARVGGGA